MVDIKVNREFFEGIPKTTDKKFLTYIGAKHEPFNDTCREEVLVDMKSWMLTHLSGTSKNIRNCFQTIIYSINYYLFAIKDPPESNKKDPILFTTIPQRSSV